MKWKKKIEYIDFQYGLRGVITVEMSYVLPIVFGIFLMIIYTVFYYHDKNIMIGAAAETAVLGAQLERRPDEDAKEDMREFYRQRIEGKMILFSETSAEIGVSDHTVTVIAVARRRRMSLEIRQCAAILKPEEKIRRKRRLEEVGTDEGYDPDGNRS